MAIDLIVAAGAKDDRIHEGIAEADIDQPRTFQVDSQQHVIELRTEASILSPHTSRQHLHPESQRVEQFAEQPVQLVAESAAAPDNNFLVQLAKVQADRR